MAGGVRSNTGAGAMSEEDAESDASSITSDMSEDAAIIPSRSGYTPIGDTAPADDLIAVFNAAGAPVDEEDADAAEEDTESDVSDDAAAPATTTISSPGAENAAHFYKFCADYNKRYAKNKPAIALVAEDERYQQYKFYYDAPSTGTIIAASPETAATPAAAITTQKDIFQSASERTGENAVNIYRDKQTGALEIERTPGTTDEAEQKALVFALASVAATAAAKAPGKNVTINFENLPEKASIAADALIEFLATEAGKKVNKISLAEGHSAETTAKNKTFLDQLAKAAATNPTLAAKVTTPGFLSAQHKKYFDTQLGKATVASTDTAAATPGSHPFASTSGVGTPLPVMRTGGAPAASAGAGAPLVPPAGGGSHHPGF